MDDCDIGDLLQPPTHMAVVIFAGGASNAL
jgi:hypothetical protein